MRNFTFLSITFLFLLTPFRGICQSENVRTGILGNTIPYTLPWDDMPVDLSFVYQDEKPAGKHGFLKAREDHFVFEDGSTAKFWGTNFNSAQIFPSHEHSEKVAKRLAKIGVNIVRFHQMDGEWSTPNLFQFTRGENKSDTQSFDSESLDRLDYLIYCLKREGIYVYMDMLTYRRFKAGDGVESVNQLGDAAKPYSSYSRKLIDLQKKFNQDLWAHFNPYTQLAYKDEPAIAMAEITNECDLWSGEVTVEPYRSELEKLYRDWAAKNKVKTTKDKIVFDTQDIHIQQFYMAVSTEYYREITRHLREMGVKIPVSGTNWTRNTAHLTAQASCDFVDSHAYLYGWRDGEGNFGNESSLGSPYYMSEELAFYNVQDKPFFVSEWDMAWPNEWRAESSLLMAAVGALQDWGGFAIHTYRYSLDENVDMIGKPVTGNALNGVHYRGGVFDTFNDPAKFGLFYHAALILRRGDVKPAEKTVNIKPESIFEGKGKATALTVEKHKIETVLPGMTAKGDILTKPDVAVIDLESDEILSDTKQLYRNLRKKIGWIDTPNTKAVYGFVGKEGGIALTNCNINVKTDFATLAISTLTNEPIEHSSNMLLTAVGRADNSGSKYNLERTRQIDPGHGPILVEIIEATVEIKTDKQNLRVMAINPQGMITGYMPSNYKDGIFRFEIGGEYQSMYYLIQEM
jgi:hypothetical protein